MRAAVQALASNDIFLSVITLGEITKGVLRLPQGQRRTDLLAWLRGLDSNYAGRILGVDRETVGIWGEITALAEARGRVLPVADGLIGATALQHGLKIFTRNEDDFLVTGALVANPWES